MSNTSRNGISAYQSARKLESSVRLENVLAHYDGLRQAAARHDRDKVNAMVQRLEQSLQFEANPDFAWKLAQLYAYLRSCVKREDFQEACRIADELFCMWQHASSLQESTRPSVAAAGPDQPRSKSGSSAPKPSASSSRTGTNRKDAELMQ